jgi:hypothetical protein
MARSAEARGLLRSAEALQSVKTNKRLCAWNSSEYVRMKCHRIYVVMRPRRGSPTSISIANYVIIGWTVWCRGREEKCLPVNFARRSWLDGGRVSRCHWRQPAQCGQKPSADRLRRRHTDCGLRPVLQCTHTIGAGDCRAVCEERSDDGGEREEVAFSSH